MNPLPPLLVVLSLSAVAARAAVPLDGLASNSPFMPKPQDTAAAPVATEGAAVEFRGLIATKDGPLFGLYDRARNQGAWVRENDRGADFVVRSYDKANDMVTVDYQGQKFTLPLSSARIATAAPSAVPAPAAVSVPRSPGAAGGQPASTVARAPDPARLESVAAEVRRRRALRQAAASGAPAPAANPAPAAAGGAQ